MRLPTESFTLASRALKGIWFTNSTLDAKSGAVSIWQKRKNRFSCYSSYRSRRCPSRLTSIRQRLTIVPGDERLIKIARIDPSKKITEYALPISNGKPFDIQHRLDDDSMWFTESAVGKIRRIDSAGKIPEFTVGDAGDAPTSLMAQDGVIWFTEVGDGQVDV